MADAGRRPSRTVRTITSLDRIANRRWFLPVVSAFPLTDYVLPFLPNQMLLIALSVLHPRRWPTFAATFTVAAGVGATLTATAVQAAGSVLLGWVFGGGPEAGVAADVLGSVERYGLWALAGLAVLPWPPRTGVLVCALAGLPPIGIGAVVMLGRVVPATGYAFIGARLPHLLYRVRSIGAVLEEVASARRQVLNNETGSK